MAHSVDKPCRPENLSVEGCVAKHLLEQHLGLGGNRGKPRGEVGDTLVHCYIVSRYE